MTTVQSYPNAQALNCRLLPVYFLEKGERRFHGALSNEANNDTHEANDPYTGAHWTTTEKTSLYLCKSAPRRQR